MMKSRPNRRALTLLELIIASSMMTVVVTSVAVLLRGANQAWQAVDADHARLNAAAATLRHIVRNVRQAGSVVAISPAADVSGSLSLAMPSGQTVVWDHNAATQMVNYGPTSATSLLAEGITELIFTGYRADGVTVTAVPAEVQLVRCQVKVQLPRETGGERTLSSFAWLRCW